MTLMYPKVNPAELEPHYSRHVEAMTAERLCAKSDIAAQLALRDSLIEKLNKRVEDINAYLRDQAQQQNKDEEFRAKMSYYEKEHL